MADVEEIGTRELHRRLSEVLDRAASGEVVRVTSHGRPKALILPPVAERWLDVLLDEIEGAAWQERGVREGWLRPPSGDGVPSIPARGAPGKRSTEEILREDRGE